MPAAETVSIDLIFEAQARIKDFIRRTPLARNTTLSKRLGTNLYLKLELFQKTGAFKVRGAFNKVLSLARLHGFRGLVAVSGGNHAQAVAYVAQTLGLKSMILMPESTPRNYIEATQGYGAEVALQHSIAEAFDRASQYEKEGWLAIHPFDDPLVIAGQGTIGIEVLEDAPQVTDIVASIGGGGLIGGVATAIKAQRPDVRVWGVETRGADCMAQALAAGHPITLPSITSIARTLGAPSVSPRTLALAQKYLECVTVVSDAEAIAALNVLLERAKILTEPAASCTLAAAERLRGKFTPDSHVVLVLCGGNMAVKDLCGYQTNGRLAAGASAGTGTSY